MVQQLHKLFNLFLCVSFDLGELWRKWSVRRGRVTASAVKLALNYIARQKNQIDPFTESKIPLPWSVLHHCDLAGD